MFTTISVSHGPAWRYYLRRDTCELEKALASLAGCSQNAAALECRHLQ
jgi:hypothetical protein